MNIFSSWFFFGDDPALRQSRIQKAQAEADEATQKALAAVENKTKVKAEAELLTIGVQSARKKQQFDEQLSSIETDKAKQLSKFEIHDSKNKAMMSNLFLGLGYLGFGTVVGVGSFLFVDYIRHGFKPYIRYRMKHILLRRKLPLGMKGPLIHYSFSTNPTPLVPTRIPKIFLGPSGCGKSSVLGDIVQQAKNPYPWYYRLYYRRTPVMYLSIRGNVEKKKEGTTPSSSEPNQVLRMNSITRRMLERIGYPLRDPIISTFRRDIKNINFVQLLETEFFKKASLETINRFNEGFTMFFDVCKELTNKRKNKYGVEAPPILLLDEVHDLEDSKLAEVGGTDIFNYLIGNLTVYGVNSGAVRAVIAGSSGELYDAINDTHLGSGFRSKLYYLNDPTPDSIMKVLKSKGYTTEECKSIIALCGTRLRLLEDLLDTTVKQNVEEFLTDTRKEVNRQYQIFFDSIAEVNDKERMIQIFDSLYDGKVRKLSEVSKEVRKLNLHPVLFWNELRHLSFQSDAHKNMWPAFKLSLKTSS